MDPLAISGSIAGLIALADMIFLRTYKYIKAAKHASKEIDDLSSEILALSGILKRLEVVSAQLEIGSSRLTIRTDNIHACHKTLEKIKIMLEKDSNAMTPNQPLTTLKQKLKWPLKSSQVKELIGEIERHKHTLGLALNTDGLSGLVQALGQQDCVLESINGFRNDFRVKCEVDTRIAMDKHRQEILGSFCSFDARRGLNMCRKLRQPNTGLWLIESEDFKSWLETVNGRLWLFGIPGAGKTILASLVIDEVLEKSTQGCAVAYFFCDYKDPDTQQPSRVLGSLVQQIAKQLEQSFSKVQKFCDKFGRTSDRHFQYDLEELCGLVIEMAKDYRSTIIVVDGLDECGENAAELTCSLASLSSATAEVDIKTLFLSRKEEDIRSCLLEYQSVSIAAQSQDLRLYVDAEIEKRTRQKRLNIRNHELKEHVRDTLIGKADGMFRWVSCQIDYLCDLPNDAARREALTTLPRGLYPTYERILRRVNKSPQPVQTLVQRTLRWVSRGYRMSTRALCEAISINKEDTSRNEEALCDEEMILRCCSSLVRLSEDEQRFELAHFTVQEFLWQVGNNDNDFASYSISTAQIGTYLVTTCLTYLNFQDFDRYSRASMEDTLARLDQYPFRRNIIHNFRYLVDLLCFDDKEVLTLLSRFFHPAKPNTLLCWVADSLMEGVGCSDDSDEAWVLASFDNIVLAVNCYLAEATSLHFAAMWSIPGLCSRLIDDGLDIDRGTNLGTPLQCAIMHGSRYGRTLKDNPISRDFSYSNAQIPTVKTLLEAGANVNAECEILGHGHTALHIAAYHYDITMMRLLLDYGASIDDKVTEIVFSEQTHRENRQEMNERIQLILEASQNSRLKPDMISSGKRLISPRPQPLNFTKDWNESFWKGAEFGQLDLCLMLLNERRVNVNTAEERTGLTALHYASKNDHREVVEALCQQGADLQRIDEVGETALHHSVAGQHYRCLSFLLQQDLDVSMVDKLDRTVWHTAALNGNVKAMAILLEHSSSLNLLHQLNQSQHVSIVWDAARSGSVQAVSLLIDAGCLSNAVDSHGCTPLHHAAEACSPELVRYLVSKSCDVNVLANDGSNIVHYAMRGNGVGLEQTIDLLLENGVDPFKADKRGTTPLEALIYENQKSWRVDQGMTVLQKLLRLPDSYERKDCAVTQALRFICRLRLSSCSPWILRAFELLLENGADLASQSRSGTLALQDVIDAWRNECLGHDTFTDDSSSECSDGQEENTRQMMYLALSHAPSQGPLHEICAHPSLVALAIEQRDDDLAQKLLDRNPDVDAQVGADGYSPIRLACRNGCSRELFNDLLLRSKAVGHGITGPELLREACRSESGSRNQMVQELLTNKINPNIPSAQGTTALMLAAGAGDTLTVELLLRYGSDPTATTNSGCTVAHFAASYGSTDMLRSLEGHDVDWSARATTGVGAHDRQDVTVLHIAAVRQDISSLHYLLGKGCVSNIDSMTDLKETVLYCAAWLGRSQNVSLLLSKGADSTLVASTGFSPVHVAASLGHTNVVSEFIRHGCNLNLTNSEGLSCHVIALKFGYKNLAKMIEKHCQHESKLAEFLKERHIVPQKPHVRMTSTYHIFKGQSQNFRTNVSATNVGKKASEPLRVAIQTGDLTLCQRVLRDGIALEAGYEDCDGCTPLFYSLYHKQQDIAEHLVLNGSSPIGKVCRYHNIEGLSAFALAATFNLSALLKTLLDNCLQGYLCLHDPVHPVHRAIFRRATECVEVMIAHAEKEPPPNSMNQRYDITSYAHCLSNLRVGAVPNPRTLEPFKWNATSLNIAAAVNDVKIARRLVEAGALVNVGDALGLTPLHTAAAVGNTEMIQMLLSFGANVHVRDHVFETPAMQAAIGGQLEALQILSSCGSDLLAVNDAGSTMLHLAAFHGRTRIVVYLETVMGAFDLAIRDKFGCTILSAAVASASTALPKLLQSTPDIKAYLTTQQNALTMAVGNADVRPILIRALLRRIPPDCWEDLLAYKTKSDPTPLYAASTSVLPPLQEERILLLLDFGANLETDGGDHGTALMGACAAGRYEAVQLLVRKGAKMVYTMDGQVFRALRAAKHFPEIVQWLLVGRHMYGPLLLTESGEGTVV